MQKKIKPVITQKKEFECKKNSTDSTFFESFGL